MGWPGLSWAGLRWPGLACAGLGWPGRKGRHVPRRARGASATSQMCGAARELPRIAANQPGLLQATLKCRELQWVSVNKGLSHFRGHRPGPNTTPSPTTAPGPNTTPEPPTAADPITATDAITSQKPTTAPTPWVTWSDTSDLKVLKIFAQKEVSYFRTTDGPACETMSENSFNN